MKDLSLNRLIPLAGAVLLVGCGGRSVMQSGESEPLVNGLPGGDPTKADPNNEQQFEAAVEVLTEDFCNKTIDCQGDDYDSVFETAAECAELVTEIFFESYRLNDSQCRSELINVLDCFNSIPSCDDRDNEGCQRRGERFYDSCFDGPTYDIDYFYDY